MLNDYTIAAKQQNSAAMAGSSVARVSEIPHQVDMLDRNAAGLAEAWLTLETRLAHIVRPEPPSPQEGSAARPVPATTLGAQLQEQNDRLMTLRVRIESLLQRLEA